MLMSKTFTHLLSSLLPLSCLLSVPLQAQTPGGFTETPDTAIARPLLSRTQIQNLVPQRGKFTFPAPYNTEALRLTNEEDCGPGLDCINYIGYSYWNNINNHVGQDTMLIFVGMDRTLGGAGPTLLQYNKLNDSVQNLGPLFDNSHQLSWATGELWYFSASMPTTMYIPREATLQRYDVMSKTFSTVFDATSRFGTGHFIWQTHSSADDRVHSATLRKLSNYDMLGCMVYNENTQAFSYFPRTGAFDECQIDKSGKFLLIKEDLDGINGEDNRIINLATGQERVLLDKDGAAGHSDMGHGYMIAADNYADSANTQKVWDFNAAVLKGVTVYHNNDWSVEAPAHVSHSNARPGVAIDQQFACGSSVNRRNSTDANEIICFGLDGANEAVVVAPTLANLDASGGGNDYAIYPKGNLDVTGKYFIWTTNMGGPRLDLFMVKVPDHLLTGVAPTPTPTPAPAPAPAPVPTPTPVPDASSVTPVVWTYTVNATVNGNTLTKSGGCNGCLDAGGASQQSITSGDGYLEFSIGGSQKLHYAGLSVQQAATAGNKIDFGLRLEGSRAEVRENGRYRSETAIVSGDKVRISVSAGKVNYARNGKVFYTSKVKPVYPLRAYSTLLGTNSTISNAVFATEAVSAAPEPAPILDPVVQPEPIVIPPPSPTGATWSALVNALAVGDTLTKTGGCDGCADAGGASGVLINSGAGHLQIVVGSGAGQTWSGLSVQKDGMTPDEIDFGFAFYGTYAEVRENGAYRSETAVQSGDVLRVSVADGKVSYSRNGTVFHTSTVAPVYPLRGYASLLSSGSSVQAKVVAGS